MEGIPVNGGRDLEFFNAIGGSYLLPNPNYSPSNNNISTAAYVDPYVYSAPPAPLVEAYVAPLTPGPGGVYTLGDSGFFATPTPLQGAIPIMARPEDEILTIFGVPGVTGPGVAVAATANNPAPNVAAVARFPWWWLAVGVVAVVVLSGDGRDRR